MSCGGAAWTNRDEFAVLREVDAGSGICGYCREAFLLAAEYVASREEGEIDRDVGAAESAGRRASHEYGDSDERPEMVEGGGGGAPGGGEG